ncbi:hypothetical protein ACLOJK_029989 [Asimina triloba]
MSYAGRRGIVPDFGAVGGLLWLQWIAVVMIFNESLLELGQGCCGREMEWAVWPWSDGSRVLRWVSTHLDDSCRLESVVDVERRCWMDGENGGCWASLLMGGRGDGIARMKVQMVAVGGCREASDLLGSDRDGFQPTIVCKLNKKSAAVWICNACIVWPIWMTVWGVLAAAQTVSCCPVRRGIRSDEGGGPPCCEQCRWAGSCSGHGLDAGCVWWAVVDWERGLLAKEMQMGWIGEDDGAPYWCSVLRRITANCVPAMYKFII